VRRKRVVGKWAVLLILLAVIVGGLVFFEWLGSEQPQKTTEQPVEVPAIKNSADPDKDAMKTE
jgi:hypothetical protein